MKRVSLQKEPGNKITEEDRDRVLREFSSSVPDGVSDVLILPPDFTRKHSGAGRIANTLYHELNEDHNLTFMPALGTHDPMTREQTVEMFGSDIPESKFVRHRWREDTVKVGTISQEYVSEVSEGEIEDSIEVKLNKRLVGDDYDLIISIGQVLPHSVVGMANYTKNIAVGCGGEEIINKSHYIGAVYGMERLIGRDHSPVRKLYDYVERNFLSELPLEYVLTVNSNDVDEETGLNKLVGIFTGRDREVFENAVALSQRVNITYLDQQVDKFVVYIPPDEFQSTWLGCKGIYRTRLAVADGGEIVIVAPGVERIGEDEHFDEILRKYGYAGKEKIIEYVKENSDLQKNLAVPAHLIKGSAEGRFDVTFVSNEISAEEIEEVNHDHMSVEQAREIYHWDTLNHGFNSLENGEEVYFIKNPAAGLWVTEERFSTKA